MTARTVLDVATPVAPDAGVVDVTVGFVVSTPSLNTTSTK